MSKKTVTTNDRIPVAAVVRPVPCHSRDRQSRDRQTVPWMTVPRVTVPRVTVPRVTVPRVTVPWVTVPRVTGHPIFCMQSSRFCMQILRRVSEWYLSGQMYLNDTRRMMSTHRKSSPSWPPYHLNMVAHGEGGSPMTTSDAETDLKLITLHYITLHDTMSDKATPTIHPPGKVADGVHVTVDLHPHATHPHRIDTAGCRGVQLSDVIAVSHVDWTYAYIRLV